MSREKAHNIFSPLLRHALPAFFALSFLGGSALVAQPVDLDAILPGLMRRHKVRGIQVYFFDASGGRDFAAGSTDSAGNEPVKADTIFQAADLIRPVTAAVVLGEWSKLGFDAEKSDLFQAAGFSAPDLNRNREKATFTLEHVLLLTSGFPPRAPVFDPSGKPSAREFSLPRDLEEHGVRITPSPESFALLEVALNRAHRPFALVAGAFRVPGFSVVLSRPVTPAVTDGFIENAGYYFPATAAQGQVMSYNGLYTTARSYGAFLQWILKSDSPEARQIRRVRFRYASQTGGTAPGFRVQMGPAGESLRIEGRSPGYSSSAILLPDGRGAVILANSEKPVFHADALRALFGTIVAGEPTLCGPDQPGKGSEALSGFYRPRGVARVAALSFVQDLQISGEPDTLAVTGILEADRARRLSRLAENVYCIVGGPSDGTRVVVRHRADGTLDGLDTDLVQYDRIPWAQSAYGLLLWMALFISIFAVGLIVLLSRRRGAV